MKHLKIKSVLVLFLISSSVTFSQNKWSVEFRPNIDFPTEKIEDSKLTVGFGFEAAIGYRFMEHLGAYLGWGYNNFKIEDEDMDFDETGYTFGFQFVHPLGTSESLSYLIRAGAIYNHIEIEDQNGNLIEDTGHGLGWEAGIGLDYKLGSNWSLRPQIGYRALSRDATIEDTHININVNYVAFGLGIVTTF